MVMSGTQFLVLLFLFSHVYNLSSDQDRVNFKRKHRHAMYRIPPPVTPQNRTGRRFRVLVKAVERKIKRRFAREYNKKFKDLNLAISRLESKTQKALRRLHKEHRCPYGYIPYHGRCFRFVMSQTKWHTWEGARDFCQNEGANLVYLNSTLKHQFVVNYLRKNFGSHVTSVFTSGIYCGTQLVPFRWEAGRVPSNKISKTWKWSWRNTTVGNDPADLQWCTDIPKPIVISDLKSCLVLDSICDWKWSAGKCMVRRPFICEMAKDPSKRICTNCW